MAAVLWLLLGVALIIAEVLSGDFVLVMLGVAGLSASITEALTGNLVADLVVFAVVAVGLVLGVRPVLRRRLGADTPESRTNVAALKGAKAIVLSTVDEHGGQVRIGGEVWSARSYEATHTFEPGRQVIVMDISGATAVVWAEN
ncbi:NfeD family protein [Kutzneria viridogrisea]|uniref:NfeD-like C-terminal domain-containing protein n=2 Tax=Kutzneria TaxID=43356 RepID=W5WHV6_9PSEU|nr:NfeD family protein [Kutzneria albida]AHH97739.1 hypothetical protein KALB_4377 [Kutzneria albida DSM 43870]MBA8924675.1 membrane protein implicated in regulation of membrane protease activity [Kutzneria viridogrisea]